MLYFKWFAHYKIFLLQFDANQKLTKYNIIYVNSYARNKPIKFFYNYDHSWKD